MISDPNRKIISFLVDEIGLLESSIELGIKLSIKNNTPLPILLWRYGIITIEELDQLYTFLF
ncbi:DUF2949 domain-containing protein [Prochlorococcus sp. AH-716-K03]|nr:DUF2949 domain-containing protein [Prochlorococcus sp. AH-716-K03]